jgi:hypothetical protein
MKKRIVVALALLMFVANLFAADPSPPTVKLLVRPTAKVGLKRQSVEDILPALKIRPSGDTNFPNMIILTLSGKPGERLTLLWDWEVPLRDLCSLGTFEVPKEGFVEISSLTVYPGSGQTGLFRLRKEVEESKPGS